MQCIGDSEVIHTASPTDGLHRDGPPKCDDISARHLGLPAQLFFDARHLRARRGNMKKGSCASTTGVGWC